MKKSHNHNLPDIRLNFDGSLDWKVENLNDCVKLVQLLVSVVKYKYFFNRTFEILVWNRSVSGMESGFLITTKPHLYPGCRSIA